MKNNLKNIIEEKRKEWLEMYSQSAEQAARWWNDRNSNDPEIPTESESAFDLISSIAALIRFSGKSDRLIVINELACDERKELTLAALDYILNSSLKKDIEKIINSNDEYEEEEIDLFEDILQTRDDFQATWDIIKPISVDFIENDAGFFKKYARTRCFLVEIDELLASRMDIVAVASRSLELVCDLSKISLDKTDYWWLYEARDYDNKTEDIITNFSKFVKYLNIPPKTSQKKIEDIENFFQLINPNYQFQAAQSENFSYLLKWEKSISELRKYLKNKGEIFDTAKLDDYIRKIDTEFSASWSLEKIETDKKVPVLIIATDTNKFLATAEFEPETKTITLDNVLNKKVFETYTKSSEKLLLIVLLNPNA